MVRTFHKRYVKLLAPTLFTGLLCGVYCFALCPLPLHLNIELTITMYNGHGWATAYTSIHKPCPVLVKRQETHSGLLTV